MDWFLKGVFVPCEGLALVQCMRALKAGDVETLQPDRSGTERDRPAAAVRAASTSMGKRLLSLFLTLHGKAPG